MAVPGYAGKVLRLDLSSGSITEVATAEYASRFIGGRGLAAKIYWDEVSPTINALDENNRLIFATGPLAGLPVLGGSRWVVCSKDPATTPQQFCYGNFGGRWGADLKFAGYDAIVVEGKSDIPTYLLLNEDSAELKDASTLWSKGSLETREILKDTLGSSARVVAIGPAGENMAAMATIIAENDATGSKGLGAVMGSKKLKAIVIRGHKQGVRVAQPEKLRELIGEFREFRERLPKAMGNIPFNIEGPGTKRDPCYGCLGNCRRLTYETAVGKRGKFICFGAGFYRPYAERYYGGQTEIPFYANRLCNEYGVDVWSIELMIIWLGRCYREKILSEENTGIPLSKVGSLEFIDALVRKVALREGFGNILAEGIIKAADSVGQGSQELLATQLSKAGQREIFGPRLYILHAIPYAMEPRPPMSQFHETTFLILSKWLDWVKQVEGAYVSKDVLRRIAKIFWGSAAAADFSTYEGKALATKLIQDRDYARECLILCSWIWPITDLAYSEDHVGDPTLESRILSAVTGNSIDEEELNQIGERIFNLQRAIHVREGHQGREYDKLPENWHTEPLKGDLAGNPECLVPGKGGEVISRKGSVVDKLEFEKLKDEYYQLRQWDIATGLQTRAKLEKLGLSDIAEDLERRGLLA